MRRLLTVLMAASALILVPGVAHAPTQWDGQFNPAATIDITQVAHGKPLPCSEDDLDCIDAEAIASMDYPFTTGTETGGGGQWMTAAGWNQLP